MPLCAPSRLGARCSAGGRRAPSMPPPWDEYEGEDGLLGDDDLLEEGEEDFWVEAPDNGPAGFRAALFSSQAAQYARFRPLYPDHVGVRCCWTGWLGAWPAAAAARPPWQRALEPWLVPPRWVAPSAAASRAAAGPRPQVPPNAVHVG